VRQLVLGNDWEIVRDMTEFSTTTGAQAPKSGLTLTGYLSQTKTGATIHATLSKSLAETGVAGRYAGTVLGSDLTTQLTSLLGTLQSMTLYERVVGASYQDYEPITVLAARQAGS
jgi:hypothetical protein